MSIIPPLSWNSKRRDIIQVVGQITTKCISQLLALHGMVLSYKRWPLLKPVEITEMTSLLSWATNNWQVVKSVYCSRHNSYSALSCIPPLQLLLLPAATKRSRVGLPWLPPHSEITSLVNVFCQQLGREAVQVFLTKKVWNCFVKQKGFFSLINLPNSKIWATPLLPLLPKICTYTHTLVCPARLLSDFNDGFSQFLSATCKSTAGTIGSCGVLMFASMGHRSCPYIVFAITNQSPLNFQNL